MSREGPDLCCEEPENPFDGPLRIFNFYRASDDRLVAKIDATQLAVAEIVFLTSVAKGNETLMDDYYEISGKPHRIIYFDPSIAQGDILVEETGDSN